jgi:hypothetical protein
MRNSVEIAGVLSVWSERVFCRATRRSRMDGM